MKTTGVPPKQTAAIHNPQSTEQMIQCRLSGSPSTRRPPDDDTIHPALDSEIGGHREFAIQVRHKSLLQSPGFIKLPLQ